MNNDLISRSAVIEMIKKKRLMVGKHDLSAEYKLLGVQEEIENLPTAYDVDKVTDAIEYLDRYIYNGEFATCRDALVILKDVLEIVKSGGAPKIVQNKSR